jgi:hypothetical protein
VWCGGGGSGVVVVVVWGYLNNNNTTPTKVVLKCFGLLVGLWQIDGSLKKTVYIRKCPEFLFLLCITCPPILSPVLLK